MKNWIFGAAMLLGTATTAQAQTEQPVTLPMESQKASISQTIGLTEIKVTYNSPAVKGRKVWGGIVPYGEVWRAGANANTIVSIQHDLKINGQDLKAGTYGFHLIPTESGEWTLIFSKTSTDWGSYFYKETEDALRVKVAPQDCEMAEMLMYGFSEQKEKSTLIYFAWEKKKVSVKIEVDVDKIVVENLRAEFRSTPFWGWTGLFNAAAYCFDRNINEEEAMGWVKRSVANDENFSNLNLLAQFQAKKGMEKEAKETKAKALEKGSVNQFANYSYDLMGKGKNAESIEIMEFAAKKFDTWQAHYYLADAYKQGKMPEKAKKSYEAALAKAPADKKKIVENAMK